MNDNNVKIILITIGVFALIAGTYTQIEWNEWSKTKFKGYTDDISGTQKYTVDSSGKIVPTTILTPEQLKLQNTEGCLASTCHTKFGR